MKKATYDDANRVHLEHIFIIVLGIALLMSLTFMNIAGANDSSLTPDNDNRNIPVFEHDISTDVIDLSAFLHSSQTPGWVDPNTPK
jgi:hypothetical protein